MSDTAKLELDGKVYELPVVTGTEGERAIDISTLRSASGAITLDDGSVLSYANDVDWLTPSNHLLITDRDNHRALDFQFSQIHPYFTGDSRAKPDVRGRYFKGIFAVHSRTPFL